MGIEKFKGTFSKESGGVTIVVNSTLEALTDVYDFSIYGYLLTKSSNWLLNVQDIMNHFSISRNRVYRSLNSLLNLNILKRKQVREKGKFTSCEYVLHLKPLEQSDFTPCTFSRYTAERDTVKRDTYKTSNITKTNNINTSSENETVKSAFTLEQEFLNDVIRIYHEELQNLPLVRVIDRELKSQLLKMKKNWPSYQSEGQQFSLESFRNFIRVIKSNYTWFLEPYTTEAGKIVKCTLRKLTREINITKIVNGEFSSNAS